MLDLGYLAEPERSPEEIFANIHIDQSGKLSVTIEFEGFVGKACLQAAALLLASLKAKGLTCNEVDFKPKPALAQELQQEETHTQTHRQFS